MTMLLLAFRSSRARLADFAGLFLALAIGVGLITVMGLGLAATLATPPVPPERFATAAVVVHEADQLRVDTPCGTRTAT
ncbi:MAG: hypothetical protein ACRDNS_22620, partial [Trebonia sp.]